MNKEIQKVETSNSPAEMIRMAVSGGADLDKLERLLAIQERWEANEARKQYHEAMAEFKANPPKIDKDKTVSYGNTKYNHASLGNVTEKISAELSKYGLSASWTTKQNGAVSVTCRITHKKGHSEETTLTAAADSSGSKNSIQAIGSTITYLERYTLLALTGLATYEQDDDGQASAPRPDIKPPQEKKETKPEQDPSEKKVTEYELAVLTQKAKDNGYTPKELTAYFKTLGYTKETVTSINRWDYDDCLEYFSKKKEKENA